MIDRWARMASVAPRIANLFSHAPGLSVLLRHALQLAPQRELPRFAPSSFRQWARQHDVPAIGRGRGRKGNRSDAGAREVMLWVDTFNNYFHPETSQAALHVLRAAGFTVGIPSAHLCCGRPLYDFGLLDRAKQYLRQILEELGPEIDAGRPIVVLEPSCASVFRDELRNLFPADARADRLRRQTFLLSEFLEQQAPGYQPPRLSGAVLLHGHCHHKAIMKMGDEEALLKRTGADVQLLDSGCCGMAGPFGFLADKFSVSQAVGERVLFPAVRRTPPDTLIVSDGFSCQEQILQGTGRRAIHLAEAIAPGLRRDMTGR
jgi:Fe-S oxidoreductase